MRFNSVKRASFGNLARHVNRSMDQVFKAARDSAVDNTMIAKEAIKGRGLERRAAMKAEAEVAEAGLRAKGQIKMYGMKADTIREEGKQKAKKARMAGVLGGLGALAGGYVLGQGRKQDKKDADERDAQFAEYIRQTEQAYNTALSGIKDKPDYPEAPTYTPPKLLPYPESGNGAGSTDTPSSGDGGASSVTELSSQPLSGSYDLTTLTPENWKTLSRAVSGEAGPGDDRYAVVGSILNRVTSDQFPGTIRDVVYQNDGKGTYQYEAFTKGTDFDDPELTADLSSKEGQAKILKALSVLDGRTDFKGQSMLKYRSNKGNKDYDGDGIPDMDPMFHPKGNLYHYSHQT